MDIRRDELFHFIRWMNLLIGLLNASFFFIGAGYHILSLGFINITIWALTRKVKE